MANGLNSITKQERRGKLRISTPFHALVRGINASGKRFEFETLLDNVSASGAYLQISERVNQYSKLDLFIELTKSEDASGPLLEAEGVVLRLEPKSNGFFGLAVVFTSHRFTKKRSFSNINKSGASVP
jgi:hypothetical protein